MSRPVHPKNWFWSSRICAKPDNLIYTRRKHPAFHWEFVAWVHIQIFEIADSRFGFSLSSTRTPWLDLDYRDPFPTSPIAFVKIFVVVVVVAYRQHKYDVHKIKEMSGTHWRFRTLSKITSKISEHEGNFLSHTVGDNTQLGKCVFPPKKLWPPFSTTYVNHP